MITKKELEAVKNINIDLQEVIRQQEEHILDLEMKLMESTNKWAFLQAEIQDLRIQKELERQG